MRIPPIIALLALAAAACTPPIAAIPADRPASIPEPPRPPEVEQPSDHDVLAAAAAAWQAVPIGVPVIAIHQENLLLRDPTFNHEPYSIYDATGMIRLVAARYLLDGAPISVRSALEVYPELDVHAHRPPPTEWYYARPAKDEKLRAELASLVGSWEVTPGEHVLVAELVYTLPRCCYAGCFPRRLAVMRHERRFRATGASAHLFRVRFGSGRGESSITTPLEERIKLRVEEEAWTRAQALVPLLESR